jgi:hypothetical protein
MVTKSLIEAICRICWSEETRWNSASLDKLLPQIRLPSPKLYPPVWRQAKDFIRRNNVDEGNFYLIVLFFFYVPTKMICIPNSAL